MILIVGLSIVNTRNIEFFLKLVRFKQDTQTLCFLHESGCSHVSFKDKYMLSKKVMHHTNKKLNISYIELSCSITVHPNRLLIASGQSSGHNEKEGRVSEKNKHRFLTAWLYPGFFVTVNNMITQELTFYYKNGQLTRRKILHDLGRQLFK